MRTWLPCISAAALLVFWVPGCSDKVTSEAGSTSSGSSTSSSSSSSSGGGSGPGFCGAFYDRECPVGYWCSYGPACATADGAGVCRPTPTSCEKNCSPACGCDGAVYCNACFAANAGVDLSTSAACMSDGGSDQYSAQQIVTNVLRFAFFKVDPQQRCTRLVFAMLSGSSLGMTLPQGWILERAEITNKPSDCALVSGQLPPAADQSAKATGASGSMTFPKPQAVPTLVTVHGGISFAPNGWVPGSMTLDVDSLPISP